MHTNKHIKCVLWVCRLENLTLLNVLCGDAGLGEITLTSMLCGDSGLGKGFMNAMVEQQVRHVVMYFRL